jgi:hypothetical protein
MGEVVKVLAVPLPFQLLIEVLIWLSFAHSLADSEATPGGVLRALILAESANRTPARIVFTMPSKNLMYLVDKPQHQVFVFFLSRSMP